MLVRWDDPTPQFLLGWDPFATSTLQLPGNLLRTLGSGRS